MMKCALFLGVIATHLFSFGFLKYDVNQGNSNWFYILFVILINTAISFEIVYKNIRKRTKSISKTILFLALIDFLPSISVFLLI